MDNCNVFEKTLILSILSDYSPQSSDEMLGLMESLESQLLIASPPVVIVSIHAQSLTHTG